MTSTKGKHTMFVEKYLSVFFNKFIYKKLKHFLCTVVIGVAVFPLSISSALSADDYFFLQTDTVTGNLNVL
jgi:hypothetical protein